MVFIGIDIAKEKFDVCLVIGTKKHRGQFKNTPPGQQRFIRWVQKKQGDKSVHACLEATGRYGEALATAMYAAEFQVSLVNPSRIKFYAQSQLQRNKTDKLDAALIADFVATQETHLWRPASESEQALQQLTARLSALVETRTKEKNRWQAGPLTPAVSDSIQQHLHFLDKQIAMLEEERQGFIDGDPELKEMHQLLTSIPGIGEASASALLALLPADMANMSARQVTAYAGLTPKQLQSGKYVRQSNPLSKLGHRRLRATLYMPALSAIRFNPIVAALADRLRRKGKAKMSIVAAAMRKLLILAYGVLKSRQPFDPAFASTLPAA